MKPGWSDDERLQLHLAAQVAGAFARAFATPQPRWQHVALRVEDQAWRTAAVDGVHVRVVPDAATLEVHGADVVALPLTGCTLEQLGRSLDDALAGQGFHEGIALPVKEKRPDHPVARGARFSLRPGRGRAVLHAEATKVLARVRRDHADADLVLMWPHHFDVSFARDLGAERMLTVGMSPGDASYKDPYWYVTPWPYPDGDLPDLDAGTWHREGWTGAVLPVGAPAPEAFLRQAQGLLETT